MTGPSPSLSAFEEALKKGGSFLVEGLWDTPKACLASLIVKATGRSVLLITGGMREDRLFGDLDYFRSRRLHRISRLGNSPGRRDRSQPGYPRQKIRSDPFAHASENSFSPAMPLAIPPPKSSSPSGDRSHAFSLELRDDHLRSIFFPNSDLSWIQTGACRLGQRRICNPRRDLGSVSCRFGRSLPDRIFRK